MNSALTLQSDISTQLDLQMRLSRQQTFKWGTYEGYFDIPIAREGFLFLGSSGSGKSTLMDVRTALLTPPAWADYNAASRGSGQKRRDRTLMDYVRGAWGKQSAETGELALQYLRKGPTYSAISQTYSNAAGESVTLVRVFWILGASTQAKDLRDQYFVILGDYDLRGMEEFGRSGFDIRRFKATLDPKRASAYESFESYQRHACDLLGIPSPLALRLLHRTQTARDPENLSVFLRESMLDQPNTFKTADDLVAQFQNLNNAYRAVVRAREQIALLGPAQEQFDRHQALRAQDSRLDELEMGLESFKAKRRAKLLRVAVNTASESIERTTQARIEKLEQKRAADEACEDLRAKFLGQGGRQIRHFEAQIEAETTRLQEREGKRRVVTDILRDLEWTMPSSAMGYADALSRAREQLEACGETARTLDEEKYQARQKLGAIAEQLDGIRAEIEAMQKSASNIPARRLAIRAQIARHLNVAADQLPFAAELIEVKPAEADWQGAIERVLRPFATSMIVKPEYYRGVADYLDSTDIGDRLVYHVMTPQAVSGRILPPGSLPTKVNIQQGDFAQWVQNELETRYNHLCVENLREATHADRAVTRNGQVKQGRSMHEKDDRYGLNDRRQWVLGFDNSARLGFYESQFREASERYSRTQGLLSQITEKIDALAREQNGLQRLSAYSWFDIDVAGTAQLLRELSAQLEAERAAAPALKDIESQLKRQKEYCQSIDKEISEISGQIISLEQNRKDYQEALSEIADDLINRELTPLQSTSLEARYADVGKPETLKTIDGIHQAVTHKITLERRELANSINDARNEVRSAFKDFIEKYREEALELQAELSYAQDFFRKLAELRADGLPKFEQNFLDIFRSHSDQHLSALAGEINQERQAIRERLMAVNEGLRCVPYNPGTHIRLNVIDQSLESVREFKADLQRALENSLDVDQRVAEERFQFVAKIVNRLASLEPADRKWRNEVLDVREHVEFRLTEIDAEGLERESYDGSGGKSGGQKQKLAATCLAAALRYQLGGREGLLPQFGAVFMDEAFERSDSEFTATAVEIFRNLGFQMVMATPMKSVMTLERYIGGAFIAHIQGRQSSTGRLLEYDTERRRLVLGPRDADDEDGRLDVAAD